MDSLLPTVQILFLPKELGAFNLDFDFCFGFKQALVENDYVHMAQYQGCPPGSSGL